MRVVFRADASSSIGSGHVMRCLTLADTLRAQGVTSSFICRTQAGDLCESIETRGFRVRRLAAGTVSWQADANETRAELNAGDKPDWLAVDHYELDRCWETALRDATGRIMVLDDMANRPHDCDVLLDQNLVADMTVRYADKVPAGTQLLLGPKYALLHPAYAGLRERRRHRGDAVRRVLVFFGGADRGNFTGRCVSALIGLNRPDIDVDVVIAESHPRRAEIRGQINGHPHVHLHSGLPTLAPLMAEADLAVGAGGATTWERLCLGVPAVVVTQSQNQRPIAEELSRRGLIQWLGDEPDVDDAMLRRALENAVNQGANLANNVTLPELDGRGVYRVSAAMMDGSTVLRLRHAIEFDEAILLEWANDPVTRRNGFAPDPIPAATHHAWFHARLHNRTGCRLYIAETTEGQPVGQVRFDQHAGFWEVNYSVARAFRERGLGRRLLQTAISTFGSEQRTALVLGRVKDDNLPSQKIFDSLGFELDQTSSPGMKVYRRVLDDADR